MKIYTKTGDQGTTSLFGGTRVPKHHIRIESFGTIDELNAHIGLVRDQQIDQHHKNFLTQIQENLFTIGAILATAPEKKTLKNGSERLTISKISEHDVLVLEDEIDRINEKLSPMTHFILPGGHAIVSYCHIARCVCRRAERWVVHLNEIEPTGQVIVQYLNRLSDYLFILARKLTFDLGLNEIKWIPKKES